jgi:hypothetical protein
MSSRIKIIILLIILTIFFYLFIREKLNDIECNNNIIDKETKDVDFIENINHQVLLNVGDVICNYKIPGILDGLASYLEKNNLIILVNHELRRSKGDEYSVKINNNNQNQKIKGARISKLTFDLDTKKIIDAELAYNKIIYSNNKGNKNLSRFCSSSIFNFSSQGGDLVYFCGEETMRESGRGFALDVESKTLYQVEAFGKHSFENIVFFPTNFYNKVVAIIGDDRRNVPLFLYIGNIDKGSTDFLDRHGLKNGKLYGWISEPNNWDEKGNRSGYFKEYTQENKNSFHKFKRIEDVAFYKSNNNNYELIFNSTTGGKNGRIFHINIDLDSFDKNKINGTITNIYDKLKNNDINTITMPDNICIDKDKNIYIQEDNYRSKINKIWRLELNNELNIKNIIKVASLMKWGETSGIIEVSNYFNNNKKYFLFNTQLVGGKGQLILFWF